MNTKKFLTYAGMSMLMAGALSSCAGDEPMADTQPGREVNLRVKISRENVGENTRSTLQEINGSLKCTWEANDCVLVTDSRGNKLGVLKVREGGAGNETAEFDGNLVLAEQGKVNLNFFYLGRNNSSEEKLLKMTNPAVLDFSAQSGTLASLSDYDFFSSTQEVTIAGNSAYTEDMGLTRRSAFGHFELIFPTGVNYNGEEVTIAGDGVYSTASLGLDNGYRLNSGSITLTGTKDFYITMLPNAGEELAPVFTVTVNGEQFEGKLSPREVKASEFLRKSQGVGVPVVMERGVDHSKNPLSKWAEADLVYTKGAGNGFAANADMYGSLYQWGRNAGWTDYRDAMGTQNYDKGIWGYGCYRMNGDSGHYLAGTGFWQNGDDWLASTYNSVSQIRGNKEYFMFRPIDPKDADNATGEDYWVEEAFGDGGSTWAERAAKCGYENVPIAPDGWRLPTEAEFDEIMPSKVAGNAPLSQLLPGKAEVRTNDECTYAIRWTLVTNTRRKLRVEAIVVPEGFTADKLTTLNWSDSNVVTREFGASGSIIGFGHNNIVNISGLGTYRLPVARPMPGYETHTDVASKYSTYTETCVTMTYTNIVDWSRNNEAGYWMADTKKVYTFFDNSALQAADAVNFGATSSYAGKLPIRPQTAYSLRCVKK